MNDDNILKVGSNEMELVDFRLIKEENGKVYEGIYGVNVAKVREIIKFPTLTELPGSPEYIDGIFDLRGVVIPVINLAKWMNTKEPEDAQLQKRIIITEFNNILIGFAVLKHAGSEESAGEILSQPLLHPEKTAHSIRHVSQVSPKLKTMKFF
jgi:two-component system chemotaxis response regulator CheV